MHFRLTCSLIFSATLTAATGTEADDVWERAIHAKGGRSHLNNVRSIVLSSTAAGGIPGLNRFRFYNEILFVPPGRKWEWNDQRPSMLGLALWVLNLSTDYFQMVYYHPNRPEKPLAVGHPSPGDRQDILDIGAVYFMQTEWFQPRNLGLTRSFDLFTPVYVITSKVNDCTYEWKLDRKSYLPRKVTISAHGIDNEFRLSDYRNVAGIMLPHKVMTRGVTSPVYVSWDVRYQLDVDYDEGVFDRPPSIAAGIDGWRRKQAVTLHERSASPSRDEKAKQ